MSAGSKGRRLNKPLNRSCHTIRLVAVAVAVAAVVVRTFAAREKHGVNGFHAAIATD